MKLVVILALLITSLFATDIKNGNQVVLKSGSIPGGVSDNFPIQVARDMGADIIIAVDVSENFDKDLDVNSYFVVMGKLVNILMRKNANESIATLTDKYPQIIQKGVDATINREDEIKIVNPTYISDNSII